MGITNGVQIDADACERINGNENYKEAAGFRGFGSGGEYNSPDVQGAVEGGVQIAYEPQPGETLEVDRIFPD